jgi:hypothetical protein
MKKMETEMPFLHVHVQASQAHIAALFALECR